MPRVRPTAIITTDHVKAEYKRVADQRTVWGREPFEISTPVCQMRELLEQA